MRRFALRYVGSRAGASQSYFTGASVSLDPGAVFIVPPDGVVVGRRAEAGLRIASSVVGPRHVSVRAVPEGLWLEDPGSTNGTCLRGAPVRSGLARVGDTVTIAGAFDFEVIDLDAAT